MFKKCLNENIVILDGAMGTELIKRGLKVGESPEELNVSRPEIVTAVHQSYIDAGSKVIFANTFGANRAKIAGGALLRQTIISALKCARAAAGRGNFVALDIGPTGELLEPLGSLSFEEAIEIFKEVVLIGRDYADLITIETMTGLYEMKAALIAARENCDLAILATMSFEENMRTFTGCTPSAFALTASPFADAIGVNCSLGPDKLVPIVKELAKWTNLPLIVKANAGMPDQSGNYTLGEKEFAAPYKEFLDMGAIVIGGCCGTTPKHIAALKKISSGREMAVRNIKIPTAAASENKTVVIDGVKVIGERINPTGKKMMKQALLEGNFDYIKEQAAQQSPLSDILDINVGLAEIDEQKAMVRAVKEVQSVTDCLLQIDSNDKNVIEAGLRAVCGKAIVNSVNGETKVLDEILPIVKKYGAAVIGLTVDEDGIPKTAQKRLEIAQKILKFAEKHGILRENVFIDCLTLTVGAQQEQAMETLLALKLIKEKLNLKTVLGVSNISFGLPDRQSLNTAFLISALNFGLDLPIINPNIKENLAAINAYKALSGEDKGAKFYIAAAATAQDTIKDTGDISYSIINGLPITGSLAATLLEKMQPLEVVNKHLIPALDEVGRLYESGKIFLPQLIAAAQSAKSGFAEVKKHLTHDALSKGKIILATVKGDIHDIGKNIVKVVLQNYGYDVIDLGKSVESDVIISAAIEHSAKLVGLSALMTTTAVNMKHTASLLKEKLPGCKIMVGGAVITADYAKGIGADFYAKDANDAVKYARKVFGK